MTTTSQIVEELVRGAQDGDEMAQAQLFERYWPVIEMAVRGRKNRLGGQGLGAREQTQDLAQDAALKLLLNMKNQDWQGRSAFAAWVKKIAANTVLDSLRHHRAEKRDLGAEAQSANTLMDPAPKNSAETVFDQRHAASELLENIRTLKPDYATAVLMAHWGFSHAEIGDTLDCSAEAARKLVSRARVMLAKKNQKATS